MTERLTATDVLKRQEHEYRLLGEAQQRQADALLAPLIEHAMNTIVIKGDGSIVSAYDHLDIGKRDRGTSG